MAAIGSGGVLSARVEGAVAVVTLNRPHVHNALDSELTRSLTQALRRFDEEPSVRALVLTGAGASFCSGDDLRTVRDADSGAFRRSIEQLQNLTACLIGLRKPIVCALNGPAFGAGLELVLACDVRVATPAFACATPEVRLGLIATNAATVLLPHLVGPSRARRMLFTGERMDAAWCLAAGLVDEVVPPEDLMPAAMRMASDYLVAAPEALATTRKLLMAPMKAALDEALRAEGEACVVAREAGEGREGVDAWFGERLPAWRA